MEKIIVEASDAWKYFNEHKNALKTNLCLIASNEEYGVEIYITEVIGTPFFSVTADGYQLTEKEANTEEECTEIVQELYDKYLTGKFIDDEDLPFDEIEDTLSEEDLISERETELDDAVMFLVNTAVDNEDPVLYSDKYDDIVEDVKEHVLEYLSRKHDLTIRRPMFLEDEDGEEFYDEYPYECMIFDDEDNPIYKK
jgi:hypothetical protein